MDTTEHEIRNGYKRKISGMNGYNWKVRGMNGYNWKMMEGLDTTGK